MPLPDAGPPLGVMLHYRGRGIPCDVLRDPELDRRGQTAWVAVPSEPVTLAEGELPDLTAAHIPDGSVLIWGSASQDEHAEPGEWLRDVW